MDKQIELVNTQMREEFLSMAEAAQLKGITASALRKYLTKYNLFKTQHFKKQTHTCTISGLTRKMTVVSKTAFLMIAKHGGFPHSNQWEKKGAAPFFEKSLPNVLPQSEYGITLSNVKQLALELVDDLTNSRITKEQKKILDDMSKVATFKKLKIKFGENYERYIFQRNVIELRKCLNAYIGRRTIDNYTHLDYIKAYKYLKSLI